MSEKTEPESIPRTYSVAEVSKKRFLTQEVVRRHIRDGRLIATKNSRKQGWRITQEDLDKYLRNERKNFN